MIGLVISIIIAAIIGGLITFAGMTITLRGGTWEQFWKRELKGREYAPLTIKDVFGAIWGFSIIFSIFFCIVYPFLGLAFDNLKPGKGDVLLEELPIAMIIVLSYLGVVAVGVLVYYFLLSKLNISYNAPNEKKVRTEGIKEEGILKEEGIVKEVECTATLESDGELTTVYKVFVNVTSLGKTLVAYKKFKYGEKTFGMYAEGDVVTVTYNKSAQNPRRCKIVKEESDFESKNQF